MQRREFLRLSATVAAATSANSISAWAEDPADTPIIDSHIHLFDPTRPGGVPWPEKTDTALYKPATPERYAGLAAKYGIVGAVAVEASPLNADNDWLLGVAETHPLIVGIIGDLIPGTATYGADLDRLHANPLFLGIRYGNIWDRDLAADKEKPGFLDGLKALSKAGLVFESANPDPRLLRAIYEISHHVPELRIVVDHLPHAQAPTEPSLSKEYWANLHALAKNPNVFVKLSEIPVLQGASLVTDQGFYRAPLDALWEVFGDDHILFGSDWPNSDHVASFDDTLGIVRGYIDEKPAEVQAKYYWKNSARVYRWHPRKPDQPRLLK